MTNVRVRFAPSPTGSLHLGGARTALFNYAFAKHHGGTFVLRVEDTDQERSSPESQLEQMQDLQWLGLVWDEGPDCGGPHGPYQQSQRLASYQEVIENLLARDLAYYCFLSDADIEALREQHGHEWQSPYREYPKEKLMQMAKTQPFSVRMRISDPQQVLSYEDAVRGQIDLPVKHMTDFVIMRQGGMPVYNFCCVVDDHAMAISHVFRGEEHLPNTAKQLLLYQAMGWQPPVFGHLSVIVNAERKKLSKRDGAVSVSAYRQQGFLPQGLLNAIGLLGWSHPEAKEIFALAEMVRVFDGKRLGAASAVFDVQKTRWTNAQHLRQLPLAALADALQPWLRDLQLPSLTGWLTRALAVYQTEMELLEDVRVLLQPFSASHFQLEDAAIEKIKGWPQTLAVLSAWQVFLATQGDYLQDEAFQAFVSEQKACNHKGAKLFMPLRVALIGQAQGAEMQALVALLPTEVLKQRLAIVMEALS